MRLTLAARRPLYLYLVQLSQPHSLAYRSKVCVQRSFSTVHRGVVKHFLQNRGSPDLFLFSPPILAKRELRRVCPPLNETGSPFRC